MTGNIYFIKCKNFIKIGYAKNVSKRLGELQIGNPYELQIMAVVPGTPELERIFQYVLAPWHERGEWFRTGQNSPIRKVMVLLNNGHRPKTIADVCLLRDFAPKKGYGRGIFAPDISSFSHPYKKKG